MFPGDLIDGRFLIDRRIGAGGMGVVFAAHDQLRDRPVAIKVFVWRTAVEVERAQREIQILVELAHPAIVAHVADGVTESGQLYMAMDWVDGTTVADRLDGDGLTLREAMQIIRPIASALARAHDAGVLHRDIKPTNILLAGGSADAAMLIDFGIARVLDATKSLTLTGTAIGTPGYMSPEQARGQRELTPAVDVFGLGCLLYECITGRAAFSGTIAAAVLAKVLFAEPQPIRELCPEAPDGLVALLDRMLRKKLVQRLPDCGAVVDALAALGPMPDGPRRSSHSLSMPTVVPAPTRVELTCLVGATRGSLDDVLEPPSTEACRKLVDAADASGASLEVFATGAVVAHLSGEARDASHRAATLALAMREILPGWTIAISSGSGGADAIDTGTQLLQGAAMAAIFSKGPEAMLVTVDRQVAKLLHDAFEVTPGESPRLVRRLPARA